MNRGNEIKMLLLSINESLKGRNMYPNLNRLFPLGEISQDIELSFQLGEIKERYLHINPALYKHQTNGRLD